MSLIYISGNATKTCIFAFDFLIIKQTQDNYDDGAVYDTNSISFIFIMEMETTKPCFCWRRGFHLQCPF